MARFQGRGLGGGDHMAWTERQQDLKQQVASVQLRDCEWIVVSGLLHTAGQGHILVRAGGPGCGFDGLGRRPGLRECSGDCHSRWIRDCSLPCHHHPAPSASLAQEDCLSSCRWRLAAGWKRWRWKPWAGAWGRSDSKKQSNQKQAVERQMVYLRARMRTRSQFVPSLD
jgi:hypothetical protein